MSLYSVEEGGSLGIPKYVADNCRVITKAVPPYRAPWFLLSLLSKPKVSRFISDWHCLVHNHRNHTGYSQLGRVTDLSLIGVQSPVWWSSRMVIKYSSPKLCSCSIARTTLHSVLVNREWAASAKHSPISSWAWVPRVRGRQEKLQSSSSDNVLIIFSRCRGFVGLLRALASSVFIVQAGAQIITYWKCNRFYL